LPRELIVFGELGLTGELRPVANGQERLREASKHGFKHAIVPFANRPKERIGNMTIHGVKTLAAALEVVSAL
jgi:DNA repair protein RadA/Sms